MHKPRSFLRSSGGGAAVEFALVAPLVILTIVFIFFIGLTQYLQLQLEYATNQSARRVLLGSAQSSTNTLSTFTNNLCTYLPAVMTCSNVIVNLYIVPKAVGPSGYYTYVKSDMTGLIIPALTPGTGQFQLGVRGDYQYLQVIYPVSFLPSFFAPIFSNTTYNGIPAYLAMSTAAFRNEQY